MTKRVLVTGGAGFIGSHLTDALIRNGLSVTVLDDLSTGHVDNLASARRTGALKMIVGDVMKPADLDLAMTGVASIFHCAAKTGVRECLDDWLGAHRVNASGTVAVFEAAQRFGNVPVVYASSAAIYGNRDNELCHERLQPKPISPYGVDKLTCELQAKAFWEVHGLPSAGLRFFNVFGPRQNTSSPYSGALVKFVFDAANGRPHRVYGDGHQTRDFVHVKDAVAGLLAAMDVLDTSPDRFVSNLCTGRSISILELIGMIDLAFDRVQPSAVFDHPRPGEIRHSRGDTTLMRDKLGLQKTLSLETGIAEYLNWLRHQAPGSGAVSPMRSTGS